MFEEDVSHSSDIELSFDLDCWVEVEFFELLFSDEVHSFDIDLWVEEEFFFKIIGNFRSWLITS